jgi:hypothetical protein
MRTFDQARNIIQGRGYPPETAHVIGSLSGDLNGLAAIGEFFARSS